MKYLLVFAFVLFFGCKKSQSLTENKALQGTWELRGAYGQMSKTFEPGEGSRIIFNGDFYTFQGANAPEAKGQYQVVFDAGVEESVGLVIPAGRYAQRVKFDGEDDPKVYFEISNDSLHTIQGFFPSDGGVHQVYVKVAD